MNTLSSPLSSIVRVNLFLSPTHPCGYLPGLTSATLFVDPKSPMDPPTYEALLEKGFRRSGNQVYRPYCPGCQECLPVRLPVHQFMPQRSLRRIWEKNHHLDIQIRQPGLHEDLYPLYGQYINTRHGDGPMADPRPEDFDDFLLTHWGETWFVEFRHHGVLACVAVVDVLPHALSAVYTFFDPSLHKFSLGTMAVLWQINQAAKMGKKWLYLGYWIQGCQKMSYKTRFKPLEGYAMNQWRSMDPIQQKNGFSVDQTPWMEG